MKAYIKSMAIISPQNTFGSEGFPQEWINYPAVTQLRCIEPAYRDFLDPMASRRMSRLVKMGMCAALKCLQNAGIEKSDAIILGTGLGCLEDTEKFLAGLYSQEEKLLNPTPFIQSTHNTLAGAIALAIQCHGYNATYTHRGFSFESALVDALMHAEENPVAKILAGGFDELTPSSVAITRRLGLWKRQPLDNLELFTRKGNGSLPGEGLAFFLLGGIHEAGDLGILQAVQMVYHPESPVTMVNTLLDLLKTQGLTPADIDLSILGMNGDVRGDHYYEHLAQKVLDHTCQVGFKPLSGEYDTAGAFALWMGLEAIRSNQIPGMLILKGNPPVTIKHVLIYNHLRGLNHTFYLLSSC